MNINFFIKNAQFVKEDFELKDSASKENDCGFSWSLGPVSRYEICKVHGILSVLVTFLLLR